MKKISFKQKTSIAAIAAISVLITALPFNKRNHDKPAADDLECTFT
jgi:hypothetical protein